MIARNHTLLFQLADAFLNGRGRHADAASQLGFGNITLLLKGLQYFSINLVHLPTSNHKGPIAAGCPGSIYPIIYPFSRTSQEGFNAISQSTQSLHS